MRKFLLSIAVVAIATMSGNVFGQVTYQHDDGTAENSVGAGPTITWGNSFDTNAMGTSLTDFSVGFGTETGGSLIGESVTWAVFGDNDNNPVNGFGGAGQLATGTMIIAAADFTTNAVAQFQPLGGLNISADPFFFISINYSSDGTGGADFPAAIDQNGPLQPRSWAALNNGVANYTGGGLIGDLAPALAGNWIIRATGTTSAIPEPSSIVVVGMLSGLVLARRRRG